MERKKLQDKYRFKEGEVVYHCENLSQRMVIGKIVRQLKKIPIEEVDPETNKFKRVEKVFLVGIECYWWDDKKDFHKQLFHSRLLIPAFIVDMGEKSIKAFLES